jgi:hypothetical protein
MRRVYRTVANHVGDRRRGIGVVPAYYLQRFKRIVRLNREHQIVGHGDRILELGTGWLHWEALTLRLLWDVQAVLFDVWDNRQLSGLKNYCRQLSAVLDHDLGLTTSEICRSTRILEQIAAVRSFDELYHHLGFEYVVRSDGRLDDFRDNTFRLVVSGGVLEHVQIDAVGGLMRDTYRVLTPGGWGVHSIDTSDHLSHYDASVSKKMYLRFSENTWKRLFENDIQYINRLQRSEWRRLFESQGFELLDEDSREVDISALKLAPRYAGMNRNDLASTVVRLAMRKPASARTTFTGGPDA